MITKRQKKIIAAIEEKGALLVFPIKNKKEPLSIWSVLYPRSAMVWEWNEDSDDRIAKLWVDREAVSRSGEVVYTKWYQNRATFLSKKVFVALLAFLESAKKEESLSFSSKEVLSLLQYESPLSTKKVKAELEWQGKLMEPHFNRAMRPLWEGLHAVGYGEENDSSFPSLNIAATTTLFEDLWLEAKQMEAKAAQSYLEETLGSSSLFYHFAVKLRKKYGLPQ